jgi:hypothetical protein
MITFEELKQDKALQAQIDWDLTPQEAFQAYQIKSIDSIRYRSLPGVLYFCLYVYQGQTKLVLIKRTLKHTEEICEIPVPADLIAADLADQGGDKAPVGQYAMGPALTEWIRRELGLSD